MLKITILIILNLILVNSIKSQWMLDAYLPYDSTLNAGNPDFSGISVVDSSTSWVIGSYFTGNLIRNYIVKRNNLGWHEIKNHDVDTSIRYIDWITATDSSNAWITTSRGKMLHTTNGGYHWTIQINLQQNVYFNGLKFSKKFPNIGYTFADGPNYTGIYIFKSTNQGITWSQQFINIPGYEGVTNSISVIDSTHVWLGLFAQTGNIPKLIMTTNGGLNWNIISINQFSNTINNIQFSDNKSLGVMNLNNNPSLIFRTSNSGINWNYQNNFNDVMMNIRWIEQSSVIYFQGLSTIERSIDNGITNSMMSIPINPNSDQIHLFDAVKINNQTLYGCVVINDTKVFKLLDTLQVIGIHPISIEVPDRFSLSQNYPNPFNPSTIIKYALPNDVKVIIKIYDILGREIKILVNDLKKAGYYETTFDGSNLASGVYFYHIEAGTFIQSKKMVLIK